MDFIGFSTFGSQDMIYLERKLTILPTLSQWWIEITNHFPLDKAYLGLQGYPTDFTKFGISMWT